MMPAARYKAGAARSSFARQRMDKSGSFSRNGTPGTYLVTGWVSNATNPATVTSDKLVVVGGGACTVTAAVNIGGGLVSSTLDLRKNSTTGADGTSLGTVSAPTWTGVRTITATPTLAAGDTLSLWLIVAMNGDKTVTATSTNVDVNPT